MRWFERIALVAVVIAAGPPALAEAAAPAIETLASLSGETVDLPDTSRLHVRALSSLRVPSPYLSRCSSEVCDLRAAA